MFLRTAIIVRPDIAAIRRFTPTGVGTIASDIVSNRQKAVHPHGRGDNENSVRFHGVSSGSPPRAWGQFEVTDPDLEEPRFTPTGVGTIPPRRATRNCSPVHPHGRGDNFRINSPTKSVGGSPPRAWGQYSDETARCVEKRFTPTGVGTMRTLEVRGDINAVHPHGRGDNRLTGQTLDRLGGSPPRAWGQSRRSAEARRRQRFTPTGVGTMADVQVVAPDPAVHPHGRGDNDGDV